MKKPVNIKDISAETGLSITTVSRVLNGKAKEYRISQKSQKIVEKAAEKLNYIPNQFAANLKTGRSNTIALIVPSLNNPFFARIASEVNAKVRNYGYTTIISDSNEDYEVEELEVKHLLSRNIEGLIIVPCSAQSEHIQRIHDQGLPLICIDRYFEDLNLSYVSTDNYYGSFAATERLIEYGHKKITCIQGVKESTPNRLRIQGYKDALSKNGIEYVDIVGDAFSLQNGYLETKLLLQKEEKPTVIFTFSNTIAVGCLKALKEENVRIPDDMSLITFDDHPYLDYLATPLSCIAQPVQDISKIAAKLLFSKIDSNEKVSDTDLKYDTNKILLKPELKMKASVIRIA